MLRQPLFVPDRSTALHVLGQFQSTGTHLAIVVDEHGGIDGLLTLNNILQLLVAPPIGAPSRHEEAAIVKRGPDSWLVDGALSHGDFYSGLGMQEPEPDAPRTYHTLAGLVPDEPSATMSPSATRSVVRRGARAPGRSHHSTGRGRGWRPNRITMRRKRFVIRCSAHLTTR